LKVRQRSRGNNMVTAEISADHQIDAFRPAWVNYATGAIVEIRFHALPGDTPR